MGIKEYKAHSAVYDGAHDAKLDSTTQTQTRARARVNSTQWHIFILYIPLVFTQHFCYFAERWLHFSSVNRVTLSYQRHTHTFIYITNKRRRANVWAGANVILSQNSHATESSLHLAVLPISKATMTTGQASDKRQRKRHWPHFSSELNKMTTSKQPLSCVMRWWNNGDGIGSNKRNSRYHKSVARQHIQLESHPSIYLSL